MTAVICIGYLVYAAIQHFHPLALRDNKSNVITAVKRAPDSDGTHWVFNWKGAAFIARLTTIIHMFLDDAVYCMNLKMQTSTFTRNKMTGHTTVSATSHFWKWQKQMSRVILNRIISHLLMTLCWIANAASWANDLIFSIYTSANCPKDLHTDDRWDCHRL